MPEDKEGESQEEQESESPEEEQEELDSEEEQDEEEFDADRAMATIRNQRAAEKELKKQLAAVRKQMAKFEAAEKERERAKMTEIEKANAELAELQASHAETVALLNEMRLLTAFSRTAEGMELAFANAQARQDAFALMDLGEVSIDEDGQVDGKAMKKAIESLRKDRPHLFAEEKETGPGTPSRRRARRLPAPEGKDEPTLKPLVQF